VKLSAMGYAMAPESTTATIAAEPGARRCR